MTALGRIFNGGGERLSAIYTHREDADGLVCAMIARHCFGEDVPIVALDYTELDRVREAPCLVLDLNLPAHHPLVAPRLAYGVDRIDHDGETRELAPVVIVDHHQAAWYPPETPAEGAYLEKHWGSELSLLWHPYRCAAEIACEVFIGTGTYPAAQHLREWVAVARASDFFLKEDPLLFTDGRGLSSLVRMAGFEEMLHLFFPPLPLGSITPRIALHLANSISAADNWRAEAIAEATLYDGPEFRFAVCAGGSVSAVAAQLLETHGRDKPLVLCILQTLGAPIGPDDSIQDRRVSFGIRGPGSLELARRFGGGGHPEAAGFQLPALGLVQRLSSLGPWLESRPRAGN